MKMPTSPDRFVDRVAVREPRARSLSFVINPIDMYFHVFWCPTDTHRMESLGRDVDV